MSKTVKTTKSTSAARAASRLRRIAAYRLGAKLAPVEDQTALHAVDQAYGESLVLVEDQAFMAGLAVGQRMAARGAQ